MKTAKQSRRSRIRANRQRRFAAARGSVTEDNLIMAFVQGAKWWEYEKTGATMWPSDRNHAEGEAILRHLEGTLGKSPNAEVSEGGTRDSRIETAAQSRRSLH